MHGDQFQTKIRWAIVEHTAHLLLNFESSNTGSKAGDNISRTLLRFLQLLLQRSDLYLNERQSVKTRTRGTEDGYSLSMKWEFERAHYYLFLVLHSVFRVLQSVLQALSMLLGLFILQLSDLYILKRTA